MIAKQDSKIRQSNFELLRIVGILMVLTLHYCNASMGGALDVKNVPEGTFNYYFVRVLESLSIIAVNCFVLITGYFSYKSQKIKVRKVLDLIGIMIFYNVLIYIVAIATNLQKFNHESFKVFLLTFHKGGCWFIILYLILYIISPFLNIVIKNISQKQFKFLLIFMIIVFSIYPTFLSNTTVKDNGYGIVNFVMLYFIGAYISKYNKNNKNAFIYFLIYLAMQAVTFWNSIKGFTVAEAFAYDNIFNVIGSVALFLTFSRFKFKSKLVNWISKYILAIYIMHVNRFIMVYIWKDILKSGDFYASDYLAVNWITSILAVFVAGLIIESIRKCIVKFTLGKALEKNKIYNYEFTIEGNTENEQIENNSN